MKPIKFIDNLSFSPDGELVSAGSSYRGSAIFMRQGDLDGACAIYSLMMLLIMNHRINRRELVTRDKNPGYTSTKRLQDEFLGDLPGLYKDGFFFNDLGDKLSSSYKKVASAITFSTISGREDRISKKELDNKIRETLEAGFPVQVGYTYERGGAHSVVAIGYQEFHNGWDYLRLFCLDPAHELPKQAFWNTILDIKLDYGPRLKYRSHDYSTFRYCNVDEILIIK